MNLENPLEEIKIPFNQARSLKEIGDWLTKYKGLYDYVQDSLSCRIGGDSCVMGVLETCHNKKYKRDCEFADAYNSCLYGMIWQKIRNNLRI